MLEKVNEIMDSLNKVKGLRALAILDEDKKDLVKALEEERNKGVFECLERDWTILVAHDSNFREPVKEIVDGDGEDLSFPGIGFPEVDGKNVVSSSPSKSVHNALMEALHVSIDSEEATLLIGFDLE
jgi:hypothetical protein